MREVKFGWHMHSFPVDGSGGPAFVEQIHRTLGRAHPYFDSVWVDDHVMPWATWQSPDTPYLECFTTMAYFAAAYPSLKIGASVFCQSYRNPALLAKMAANLQLVTGGRLLFGLGAGWMEPEYRAYDFEFPKPAVRIAQLEETIQIVRRMWAGSPASFEGRYYRIENAYCEPRPDPIPPLLIGGGGEQLTLRVVAQYADVWNFAGGPPEAFEHKAQVLRVHCAAIGRDPAEIALSVQIMVNYENLDETVANLQRFVDLGATHLILNLRYPYPDGIVERVAAEVLPRVRA